MNTREAALEAVEHLRVLAADIARSVEMEVLTA